MSKLEDAPLKSFYLNAESGIVWIKLKSGWTCSNLTWQEYENWRAKIEGEIYTLLIHSSGIVEEPRNPCWRKRELPKRNPGRMREVNGYNRREEKSIAVEER